MQSRNLGLDIFRVIAISLVFYSHAVQGTIHGVYIGAVGVDLFFVLSGFLVAKPLFTSEEPYTFAFIRKFMVKRWLRTLPLYYFLISLKILLTHFTFFDSWQFYVFIHTYFKKFMLYSVSWSLAIEEWFYILLPLLALIFFRRSENKRCIVFFIVLIITVDIFWRLYMVLEENTEWFVFYSRVHLRFDSLMAGVLLSFFKYRCQKVFNLLRRPQVFLIGILMMIHYLIVFSANAKYHSINTTVFLRVFGYFYFSLGIACVLPYVETISFRNTSTMSRIISRFFLWASTLTYAIYLVHLEVLESLKAYGLRKTEIVLYGLILTVLFSMILHFVVERPFLKLKDKINLS